MKGRQFDTNHWFFSDHDGSLTPEYSTFIAHAFSRGKVPAKYQVPGQEMSAVQYVKRLLATATVNAHAEFVIKNLKSAYRMRGQKDIQIGLFDFGKIDIRQQYDVGDKDDILPDEPAEVPEGENEDWAFGQ